MIREDFLHGSLLGCLQGIQLDALAGDVVQGLAEFGPILDDLLVGCLGCCARLAHLYRCVGLIL